MAVSNEVIIAAIGGATSIIVAFLSYLTVKVQQVKKLVNGTAQLLAEQTRQDKVDALAKSDKAVADAKAEK